VGRSVAAIAGIDVSLEVGDGSEVAVGRVGSFWGI
jgi:hypothetical protein